MLSAATTSLANNANTLFPHRDDCEAATGYVLPPLSAYCQRSAQTSTSSFCRRGREPLPDGFGAQELRGVAQCIADGCA